MADQDTPPPTITAMKIPIIKKGEYDIWSMRMRQYICHTDHNLWDIIVNGDLEDEATPSGEQSSPPVPKTAKQLAARRNQERIKSILLLAIPDEYLLKFHNVPDAKSLWAAIKSRFGGNEESKKMQKNVLKHQFENFVTASNETLDKAYDRFQKLISQLEIHGAYVSKEDINQKFLRSLPPSWSQIALIMRNKPDIDEVDIDDLYNNLRVYEDELKRSSSSNSASQNLAFLSSKNTNSTNEVSTASGDIGVSTAGGINQVSSTPSAHDIAYSFLAQPTTSPQLENEDFQQMDRDNLKELDLRWQVAMLTVRIECYNCHRKGHFARECRSERSQGRRPYGGYDWSNDFEVEPVNYALMAISSSNSSSSSNSEVVKERDELKLKIEKWEGSSKNLTKILNSQMSAHDKNGLGFGTQKDDLSNKSETDSENSLTVFEVRSSDEESTLANNRFTKSNEYHAVPPPITGNPLTPRADISFAGLDEYAFRNKIIESKTTETNKTVGTTNEATIVKPKSVNETVVSKSKINRDEVIIEDWTSDDEDDVCAVKTVSSVKPNVTQAVRSQTDKSGQTSQKQGIGFKKVHKIKACFVCKSTGHLIKDCDFYDQKSPEPRVKNVVNTGERVVKLVWDYGKRVFLIKSSVLRYPPEKWRYSLDLKNIVPSGGITCLYANATADESKLWHRRLGHVNFKNINKLVKGHLVRGLPSKVFVNDHTCVACKKGKQHKASCKAKLDRIIRKPLELLHMDLFGPVSIESINKKRYCLVVTDDFSRFSWVFFLATKDETSEILCNLIIGLEKQLNHNVKIIRCDNGNNFRTIFMKNFCAKKGIKREFSVARTPQQNGIAERKNRTLIEAARTMLAYSLLPIPFWAEAVNTACYVLNRSNTSKGQKGRMRIFTLIVLEESTKCGRNRYSKIHMLCSSSRKIKDLLKNTYCFPLQPHGIRIPVKDVVQDAQEQPSENASLDKGIQVSEDVFYKEGQHQMPEDEQVWQDELEMMVTQEAAQATSTNQLSTDRPFVSAVESSFVLIGKIPINASTLPNADLPIDPNMPELEDTSDTLPNDEIINGAYDEALILPVSQQECDVGCDVRGRMDGKMDEVYYDEKLQMEQPT
ncbi:putative ribonuclease H-like domain-containing protein [Tanacetum coccineum]